MTPDAKELIDRRGEVTCGTPEAGLRPIANGDCQGVQDRGDGPPQLMRRVPAVYLKGG